MVEAKKPLHVLQNKIFNLEKQAMKYNEKTKHLIKSLILANKNLTVSQFGKIANILKEENNEQVG